MFCNARHVPIVSKFLIRIKPRAGRRSSDDLSHSRPRLVYLPRPTHRSLTRLKSCTEWRSSSHISHPCSHPEQPPIFAQACVPCKIFGQHRAARRDVCGLRHSGQASGTDTRAQRRAHTQETADMRLCVDMFAEFEHRLSVRFIYSNVQALELDGIRTTTRTHHACTPCTHTCAHALH